MDKTYQDASTKLGAHGKCPPELFEKLQEITCHMYLPSTHTAEVNKLRSCSVRDGERWSQVNSLLVRAALFMHALRANYQAGDLEESLQSQPFVANPTDCGWMTDEDGKLAVNWMQAPSTRCCLCSYCPASVCGHANSLSALARNGLKCTDMCRFDIPDKGY
ncbi:hypothetical protein GWK47_011365 [Chionoecetes opilio]|uniref:Uncharacterized protein n=1 Tax=Chionoecetes opilio TaxID=41210 RepID=A0A8J5C2P1_CHIOP|nr:hypothetical protein GWK47_011365 [Chionoecetes opilio]